MHRRDHPPRSPVALRPRPARFADLPKDQQSAATDAALRDNVAKGEMPQGKYDDWKRAKGLHVDITAKRRQLAERIADAKTNKEVQNSVKNVDVAITEAVAEKAGGWKDNGSSTFQVDSCCC